MQANMISCRDSADTACIERQEGLIAEADELRDRAEQLQESQQAGAATPAA